MRRNVGKRVAQGEGGEEKAPQSSVSLIGFLTLPYVYFWILNLGI